MGPVLAGRRVIVTRAVDQADDLAALLQQSGAIPVVIPLIEIASEPAGVAQLARYAADGFAEFDWVIVTSPNGADCLVDVAGDVVSDAVVQTVAARVAAVGTTTAEVLRAAGIEVNFVPTVQSAAGLLAEFPPDRGFDSRSGPGLNAVLIVQASNAEPTLADGFRELRLAKSSTGSVIVVAPYRTIAARVDAGQQLAALSADAVMFASGSAARAWVAVFGDSAPPVVVAIGPQTAASVTRAGLKVNVVATDHSLSGMVMALEHHLSSQR
jgi:uroporphyrinogen-III synthase